MKRAQPRHVLYQALQLPSILLVYMYNDGWKIDFASIYYDCLIGCYKCFDVAVFFFYFSFYYVKWVWFDQQLM